MGIVAGMKSRMQPKETFSDAMINPIHNPKKVKKHRQNPTSLELPGRRNRFGILNIPRVLKRSRRTSENGERNGHPGKTAPARDVKTRNKQPRLKRTTMPIPILF
jgi:hypothetical protein